MKTAVALVLGIVLAGATPATAQPEGIEVVITPPSNSIDLGAIIEIEVTVTNHTSSLLGGHVVHLDITDPTMPGSVDPEDWTATLTKDLPTVEPGTSETLPWTLQPIAGGGFSVYAVIMAAGDPSIHVSAAALVEVAERRALNPKGVLPVALGMPLLILFTMAGRRRHRVARSEE